MKRRAFLSHMTVTLIGGQLFAAGTSSIGSLTGITENDNADNFPLHEVTLSQLQDWMKTGRISSEQATRHYLKRIEAIDRKGPVLRSVIEVNPEALSIARSRDTERKSGKIRGPLHGVPVLIKDNIDTADGMMTTAGSLALLGNRAKRDAFIVQKLREAGAVILGKTNLSEWANFRSTRSVSGWSSRGGQTRNPYVLDRTPCGSSSGSGVAVAANLCAVAVGTETNGSVSCPASVNGIVTIKPTIGLVSRSGIIPIAETQDTAGPMTRTVTDAAILLGVLAGPDAADGKTANRSNPAAPDYTRFLDRNGLSGKRIGVEKSFLSGHESITALFKKAIEQMNGLGATIVEVEFMAAFRKVPVEQRKVLLYEFKDGLNNYLATANAKVKTLEEVIRFNKEHEAEVMPFFKQETMEAAQAKGPLEEADYKSALAKYDEARKAYTAFFEEHKLDAVCGPANGFPWSVDPINGDAFSGYGMYGPAAVCGYPSLTVPMGNLVGLPTGLSFLGTAFKEGELIRIGYAYEQVSKNRVAPNFKPTFPSNKV